MPNLFVITGSNGAGKSTVGPAYFPDNITDIFDGDKLYLQKRTELWKSGLRVQKELTLQSSEFVEQTFCDLVNKVLSTFSDFAYEGHFSRDESWQVIQQFKDSGYELHLIFFGLDTPALSSNRVLIRANEGGHSVDPLTLRENYYGNLKQVNDRLALFDSIKIVDTSELEHKDLVAIENGIVIDALPISEQPNWFLDHMPNLVALIG